MVELLAIARTARRISSQREWPLGFGINLAIRPAQRSQEQHSAFEALGVADGGNRNVQRHARPGKRRKRSSYEHSRNIFYDDCIGGNLHAHALHDVGQGLGREQGLLAVSGPVQSDHDAVAHQRIVAHSSDGRDVAHQHGLRSRHGRRKGAPRPASKSATRILETDDP